jgi:hypothetical protein
MAEKHPPKSFPPQLTPREYKDGSGWYVEATADGRAPENIGDFPSDAEAQDWIIHKSTAHFKGRQK